MCGLFQPPVSASTCCSCGTLIAVQYSPGAVEDRPISSVILRRASIIQVYLQSILACDLINYPKFKVHIFSQFLQKMIASPCARQCIYFHTDRQSIQSVRDFFLLAEDPRYHVNKELFSRMQNILALSWSKTFWEWKYSHLKMFFENIFCRKVFIFGGL